MLATGQPLLRAECLNLHHHLPKVAPVHLDLQGSRVPVLGGLCSALV